MADKPLNVMQQDDAANPQTLGYPAPDDAEKLLTGLLAHIQQQKVRFGLLSNDHTDVVEELTEALKYATSAKAPGARFNFSVVT